MLPDDGLLGRFLHADDGPLLFLRELLSSVAFVVFVGLVLFGASGLWPPLVAVESGSMQPNMVRGDLVLLTDPGRFPPAATHGDTGVVTYETAESDGYESFDSYGSVVVYQTPSHSSPIIHRARFWVEAGENWYDEANPRYVAADDCEELLNCPAPNAGFVTKGDNTVRYDRASGLAPPVKPTQIDGVARARIPALGCLRLGVGEHSCLR